MNTAENPPRKKEDEELEQFDRVPVSPETKVPSYKIMDDKEKKFFIANEKAKIQELRGQLVETFEDSRSPQEKQEAPKEIIPPKKQESGFRKKMAKWMMTLGLVTVAGTASAKTSDAEKNFSDSTTTSKEVKHKESSVSKTPKNTVPVYTQSKTPEGGITPTGLSNSFYENEFGITESDIGTLASQYGFSNNSALEFQSDLIDYMVEHHPDAIDGVMKKYGETNKGEGIQGLKDGNLGVRTAWLMGLLKNGTAELMIDGKKVTYSTTTPDTLEGGPQPSGSEIFNTSGYDKLVVLFDNSPSMYNHRADLAKDLKKNISSVPVEVQTFTDSTTSSFTVNNPSEASSMLEKIDLKDQHKELAVDVSLKKLTSMDVQTGKTKMVICTDEKLQDVTQEKLAQLRELASEKNVDVVFSVIIEETPYTLSLQDIQESFDDVVDGLNKSIQLREKQITEFQQQLDQTTKASEKKDLKNRIQETQEEIQKYRTQLASEQDLSNFDHAGKSMATK